MKHILPLVAAFAAALLICMGYYTWAVLWPGTGGLLPFDLRVFGYSAAEAQRYLLALSDDARAVYLLEMRWLGLAFRVVFGLAMLLGAFYLSKGRAWWRRGIFVVLALAWIGADAAENLLINEMLLRGPVALDRALVEWSSLFTRLKYVLLAVCGAALFGLWKQQRGR
ncbi:hypothetical protein [Alloyangia pacifica]|uniref:DUF1772 domain-containing protein n=1 Tax=Alloyangia pacifica TaxID=311180 RepID=A0A1I6QLV9_9RHOB|nr:hypothetical protein [Alloyangia pacifica]SDF92835.1 hypothetical protein SAMN04488245_101160 [Alloyangia pacifica]SFS53454.1 hypothetical protein SAMN04488050_102161 [Alloyangia pacifica]